MNRDVLVAVRLNSKERRALELMAAREERGLSEMLREVIREAAERRGIHTIGLLPKEKAADFA